MGEIKEKLEKIWLCQRELTREAEALQAACPHPSYKKGLTIIACIQEILICEECGHGKPIEYDAKFIATDSINQTSCWYSLGSEEDR